MVLPPAFPYGGMVRFTWDRDGLRGSFARAGKRMSDVCHTKYEKAFMSRTRTDHVLQRSSQATGASSTSSSTRSPIRGSATVSRSSLAVTYLVLYSPFSSRHAHASHFWLNEGWTTYIERLLQERLHTPAHRGFSFLIGRKGLDDDLARYADQPKYQRLQIDFEKGEDPDDAYSDVPYEKGANFLLHLGPSSPSRVVAY